MRPITEIERCLQVARRDVFSPDDAIATAASSRITMLLAELAAHPDELAPGSREGCERRATSVPLGLT